MHAHLSTLGQDHLWPLCVESEVWDCRYRPYHRHRYHVPRFALQGFHRSPDEHAQEIHSCVRIWIRCSVKLPISALLPGEFHLYVIAMMPGCQTDKFRHRTTIFSCVRLYYLVQHYTDTDPDSRYSISFVTSAIEANLAIMTGSSPALWPLIRGRVGPAGSTAAGTQQRYHASNNTGWIRENGETDELHALELGYMRDQRVQTRSVKPPFLGAGIQTRKWHVLDVWNRCDTCTMWMR